MLFNSLQFLLFFPAFVVLYFSLAYAHRWKFLLAGSIFFYACYSPPFLLLLFFSTFISWYAGNKISASSNHFERKFYLLGSTILNLGQLAIIKYLNFADDNLRMLANLVHLPYPVPEPWFNTIILPVGISFYTFHTLAYTIDIYKGITKVEKNFWFYTLFVSYWPQLLAGPIPRANQLLPELKQNQDIDYDRIRSGLLRMLLGFFKKIVIADRLSMYVKYVYENHDQVSGWTIVLGAIFFVFQVYCDFSGYSDIALGASRVLGIKLIDNFKRPFYAKNLADFWTRWHISLSTWLTDYVFFYLGAYKASGAKVVFNVLFVLTVCGLWHGANWPMVLSFTLIGIFMAIRYLWQYNVIQKIKPSYIYKSYEKIMPDWLHILTTFLLLTYAFMLFRVQGAVEVLAAKGTIVSWTEIASNLYTKINYLGEAKFLNEVILHKGIINFILAILGIILLYVFEGIVGDRQAEDVIQSQKKFVRWSIYLFLLLCISWFGVFNENEFVYFQF
jgi:alginate O-acetyltransferase complex protein AlgI